MTRNSLLALTAAASFIFIGPGCTAMAKNSSSTASYAVQSASPGVADQLAILDLISRMNQSIDANDYEAYALFYAEDGVIDSGFGPPTTGRAAIVASLNQSAPFITNKRHLASNVVINGAGETATAIYYLTVLERQTSLTIAGTAMITDEFQRGAAGWEVVRHTTRMDPATVQAMSVAMAGGAN